jgi:hypothetical protein
MEAIVCLRQGNEKCQQAAVAQAHNGGKGDK